MALYQACFTAPPSCEPNNPLSPLSRSHRLLLQARSSSLSARQRPGDCLSPVSAHALAAPGLVPLPQVLGSQRSNLADALGSISSLYSEVSEESRAADEYMQRTAQESGRSTEDYVRRALMFKQSGQMVASSKVKHERVMMELELLQGEVLEHDEGRTATDYLRRAQIFSKSAEVLLHAGSSLTQASP